jgi:hypothetical protein
MAGNRLVLCGRSGEYIWIGPLAGVNGRPSFAAQSARKMEKSFGQGVVGGTEEIYFGGDWEVLGEGCRRRREERFQLSFPFFPGFNGEFKGVDGKGVGGGAAGGFVGRGGAV